MGKYDKFAWATPPAPVPESEIRETLSADVVIIGSGISGISSAVSAAEHGLSVIVIEKGPASVGHGHHFGVANCRYMRSRGYVNDINDLKREFLRATSYRVNEEVLMSYLVNSEPAMDWLCDKAEKNGIRYNMNAACYKGEAYKEFPGTIMFECGADGVVKFLCREALELGVKIIYNTPAQQLITENGRVTGVVAKNDGGYIKLLGTKGVVLATGDISGNKEMTRDLAPQAFNSLNERYTPVGMNTGDGHRMGVWVGGELQETPFPCIIHTTAFSTHVFFYLAVNQKGKRYMNEDAGPQNKSCYSWNQDPEHPWGYSIFDSKWPGEVRDSLAYGGGLMWDCLEHDIDTPYDSEWVRKPLEENIKRGEISWRADTLEELAEKIGVPTEEFLKTVERYNEIVKSGCDTDFGKRRELLTPICKPPYYATKFGGSLLVITAGLNIDRDLRVLTEKREPIPGLYAVGQASGSIYAIDYPLTIPGNDLGRCITWGYIIGDILSK